jgi:hypothetical protein
MLFLHAGERLLARRMRAHQAHSGLREGPWERGLPNRGARGAVALHRRCLDPFAQATGGHAVWPAGDALDVMAFIEPLQPQTRANPWDRAQQTPRVGVVRRGRWKDAECHVAQQMVVVVEQGQVDGETLRPDGLGTPRRDAVAARLIGPLLAHLGQILLAVGLLDGG